MKTKKMWIFATLLLVATVMFAGCGHTHEWTEASCTAPKTCADCGETEGEALGHQLSQANYQSPAQCGVCGAVEGTVLTPDFVGKGIEIDIEAVGDSADYITNTAFVDNVDVIGKTTLTSYDICPSFEEIEARDGYECRVAVFDTTFGSDALYNGVNTLFYVTDYYNTKLIAESPDHSNPLYTITNVNINGENQPVYISQRGKYDAKSDKLNFKLTICAQVPIGYDGIVCGLVRNGACESLGNISEHYSPENFVLFRMGN